MYQKEHENSVFFGGAPKTKKKKGVQLKTPQKKKVKTTLPIFVVPFCKLEVWKPKKKKNELKCPNGNDLGVSFKWCYPQNTPKWSFLVRKPHGCWGNPPF